MHPTIQQAREVSVSGADENVPLRAAAFQAQGGVADELRVRAQTTVGRVRAGGLWAGAFIGLMVGLKLVGQSLRRRREIYEPDRGTCV